MNERKPQHFKGFTLIEVIIVIAIIGILATVVMLNYSSATAKSKYAKVTAELNSINKAVGLYNYENKDYPLDVGGGVSPATLPANAGFADYLSAWPSPPCGSDYNYDYENWGKGTVAPNGNVIGVHFRHIEGSSNSYIYYKDIYNFTQTDPDWLGRDIATVNMITCKETGIY